MSKQIRWGILGAARVNERLLPAILQAENAELVAIASRRPGAAAELLQSLAPDRTDITALDDPLALLMREDIDAVYLPMANEEHAHWALRAIKANKHVLIEKPMALTVTDIDAIQALADKANVKVMEGFMYRFHPQHEAVQQIIDSGAIGDVRMVRTCFSFPMKAARMYRIFRDIANGGGAMWDIGPYAIHTARLWFDREPESVMAMAKLNEHGADVSLAGMFDFSDGRYAQFEISFEHARRSEYEIIGTLGGIKCNIVWQHAADKPVISWWTDAGQQEQLELAAADHFVLEIEHFSNCILNDTAPLLSLADARANCAAIEAALKSVAEGQRISIDG
ncbi:Myo-inositol 2-dehydrogenase [Methylophaga lonarensis MPL]|uniref:Myo-inositol 2-dehydrogenase n=1 Tax=Methylophaga lonarensis MPL TaxID=1286106 RepID=M7PQU5_9GAMM|nr:Gfo/Idh/MocA family oxidoreductase [Methylophaga lonarensis]EMR12789.1 Myo-inositol 2-dehydrogenase [Methylophaga lonarensis MPL]